MQGNGPEGGGSQDNSARRARSWQKSVVRLYKMTIFAESFQRTLLASTEQDRTIESDQNFH